MSKIASIASRFHRPLHRQFSSPSTSTNLLNPLTHLINLKNALSKYKATWGKDLSVFDEVTKVVDPQNVRNIEKIAGSNVDSKGDNITNSDLLNEVKDLKTLASNKNKDTLKADFKSFLSQNVTTFKLSVTAFTEGYREGKEEEFDEEKYERFWEGVRDEIWEDGDSDEKKKGKKEGTSKP